MTDGQDDVVERALNDCEEKFRLGVHSYSPGSSGLTIEDGAIRHLKSLLRATFAKHLNPGDAPNGPRNWEEDQQHVLPAAFYAGALAGLYAHGATEAPKKTVTNGRAEKSLRHVSEHCGGPAGDASDTSDDGPRARWIYCPDWPGGEGRD